MCFRFDTWCCFVGVQDDHDYYGGSTAAKGTTTPHHHAGAPAKAMATTPYHPQAVRHGHQGATANGHGAPHYHNHQYQLPAAVTATYEEGRKASNDARKCHSAPAVVAGAQEKAYVYLTADGTLGKHPATNAKVADGAPYYYYHHHGSAPAHRQDNYYPYR